jgi:transposase-like protein
MPKTKSTTTGRLSGVRWEMTATGITLSGNTYSFKDTIKTLGGTWAPATKTWLLPVGTDLTFLEPPPAPKPKPREEWTKEEWDRYVQLYYTGRRSRGNIERCCQNAVAFTQYDYQGPTCYDCPRHGKTYNSYCGD